MRSPPSALSARISADAWQLQPGAGLHPQADRWCRNGLRILAEGQREGPARAGRRRSRAAPAPRRHHQLNGPVAARLARSLAATSAPASCTATSTGACETSAICPGESLALTPNVLDVGAAVESAISASVLIRPGRYDYDPTAHIRRAQIRRAEIDALMRRAVTSTWAHIPAEPRSRGSSRQE